MSGGLGLMGSPAEAVAARRTSVVSGLLWREWIAHQRMLQLALSVWLVGGWVLMIFNHPGWIIAYGVLYGWAAGQAFGGAEASEGTEEFAFALPPTRRQRYLARLAAGVASVLALTVAPLLTIVLNLPQKVWGLLVESGFTDPFPHCESRLLYVLAVVLPLAFFALTFPLAANSPSRRALGWAGLGGWLGLGTTGAASLVIKPWTPLHGYVWCQALAVLGTGALAAGYAFYLRKEGLSRPDRTPGEGRRAFWLFVVILLLVCLLFIVWSMRVSTRVAVPANRHAPTADTALPQDQEANDAARVP